MAETSKATLRTYRGNCHCGAYVFEAKLPEIAKIKACNCSICHKRADVWALPDQSNVTWIQGDVKTMKGYTFGTKQFEHKFCETCGTSVALVGYFAPRKAGEDEGPSVGLNIRCLQHGQIADIWDMESELLDGASYGTPYQPPTYSTVEPEITIEGSKLYTGSCHCGTVKVALKSKPLDKSFEGDVYECNCSGCIRAAGACAYPHKDAVIIVGEENTTSYSYGWLKAWEKFWCKTCGVFIGRRPLPLSAETVANLPEQAKKWTVDIDHLRPINLRILDGVDIKELGITHIDGYDAIPPMYNNP